jgi:SAM-dependent methyltransferase
MIPRVCVRCRSCGEKVFLEGDSSQCAHCGDTLERINDVYRLAGDSSYYWCELSQSEARAFVEQARTAGWQQALELLTPALAAEISHPDRALWKHMLPLGGESDVLDFGAGWGGLSTSLAQSFRSVTAVDLTLERCEFLALRAAQENLENVVVLQTGADRFLPFPDASYDLIALNGVLEWLPDSNAGYPSEVQIEYLKEVRRVLKPDGLVYVGIENRFGYGYWFGRQEEHAHIPFVSLMPRRLANWYMRRRRGKDYRTWTYGLRGYRRLLEGAGMRLERALFPTPDYRWVQAVLPLDDREAMLDYYRSHDQGPRSTLIRMLIRSGLFPYVVPSYGIVGRKTA